MFFSSSSRSVFDPPPLLEVILTSPTKFLLRTFHTIINVLRSGPEPSKYPIRVVCISDIHSKTKHIPDGDLLLVAGDLTDNGTPRDIQQQIDWLNDLPHRYKIAIAGNHDYWLDPRSREHLAVADLAPGYVDWKDIFYLQHSYVVLDFASHGGRKLKIYGAPQIPQCGPPLFAFQYPRGQDAWTETVPLDTDILVTHTPPKYHLDLPIALGCEFLLNEIRRVKPYLHVFGHVHAGRGSQVVYWNEAQRVYERGLSRKDGLIRSTLDVFLWICVVKTAVYGLTGLLWDRLWGGRDESTQLVNASLMYNNTGRLGNDAQVVDI